MKATTLENIEWILSTFWGIVLGHRVKLFLIKPPNIHDYLIYFGVIAIIIFGIWLIKYQQYKSASERESEILKILGKIIIVSFITLIVETLLDKLFI